MRVAHASVTVILALLVAVSSPRAESAGEDDGTIVHVLNRVAYGPRPGDVERVRRAGLRAYIEAQLAPDRIPDGDVDRRLSSWSTLTMGSRELAERFGRPLREARRRSQQTPGSDSPSESDRRLQREANRPMVELASQKLMRAVWSERQLQEVLTDFWFNHFNVDARKGPTRFLLTEYERDAIRPHILGRFRDLLGATAKSPAMLFYLDNWMSVDPAAEAGRLRQFPSRRRALNAGRQTGREPAPERTEPRRGLNENYARELLELHTLGVDGGYTQKDVTEVARAFTGWTMAGPRRGGGFRFEPRLHADGDMVVLGRAVRRGGIGDGEAVLDILANHPSTATHIATKLARRFVADDPPKALVDHVARRFLATGGDLTEVTRALLLSPAFVSPEFRRAKTKSPLDFVVSAVRALRIDPDARLLARQIQELGMPLYQCQPPTGYRDTAEAWTNTGALVGRLNAAMDLARHATETQGRSDTSTLLGEILAGDVSEATLATIARAAEPEARFALTLGSPEFQKK
jgi:uncharacterized protein (DUF1800 family)